MALPPKPARRGAKSSRPARMPYNPSHNASNDTRCHLLALPPELRLIIWEYCITNFKLPQRRKSTEKKQAARGRYANHFKQPALLLASGSVRAEALKVYLMWLQRVRSQVASELEVTLREMEQTGRETKQTRKGLKRQQTQIKRERNKLKMWKEFISCLESEMMGKVSRGGS